MKIKSIILLFIGVFSLSTSAIFVKLANSPPAITAFYRLFFSLLMLLPFLFLKEKNRKTLLTLSKRQWIFGFLSGLFLSVHYILWFESLNYTSVASSTVIVTLQPLFSIMWGNVFLNERLGKINIIGCLISIIGCVIIGWGDFQMNSSALFGDLLALLAATIISVYFLIGQTMRKNIPVIPYSALGYMSGVIFLTFYALMKGNSFTHYSISTWKCLFGLALISTICGQFVFNLLLKWISATTISMSILGEPIGTCILAYFILKEGITFQQGLGIIVILSGLIIFFLASQISNKVNIYLYKKFTRC